MGTLQRKIIRKAENKINNAKTIKDRFYWMGVKDSAEGKEIRFTFISKSTTHYLDGYYAVAYGAKIV